MLLVSLNQQTFRRGKQIIASTLIVLLTISSVPYENFEQIEKSGIIPYLIRLIKK